MQYLRSSRCLLVLDNSESILRRNCWTLLLWLWGIWSTTATGRRWASKLSGTTSREKPIGLTAKEGKSYRCDRSTEWFTTGRSTGNSQSSRFSFDRRWIQDSDWVLRWQSLALKIATTTIQSYLVGIFLASWSRVQSCLAIFGIFRPAVSSLVSFREAGDVLLAKKRSVWHYQSC